MKRLALVGAGAMVGAIVGWFLPALLLRTIDPQGLMVVQVHGAGSLGLLGMILGSGFGRGKIREPPRKTGSGS